MILNILLILIFLVSAFILWYRISQKIPELVAVQDQVIAQRLHEDSARLRIFLLHLRTFYKEDYYRNMVWRFLGKLFYRIHIVLLRLDNVIVRRLQIIRNRGGFNSLIPSFPEGEAEPEVSVEPAIAPKAKSQYWDALKGGKSSFASAVTNEHTIEGVRRRQRKIPVSKENRAEDSGV